MKRVPTSPISDAAAQSVLFSPQTVLDLFAHGSVSFLLALVAVSIVTALIGAAVDEFVRPLAQARLYRVWVRATLNRLDAALRPYPDDEFKPQIGFGGIGDDHLLIATPLLAGGPDQVSAQAARRLDRLIATAEPRPDRFEPDDRRRFWFEAMRQELEVLAEDRVDLLQSQLIHQATVRAYVGALVISVLIGALLYALALRTDPHLDRDHQGPDIGSHGRLVDQLGLQEVHAVFGQYL
jgi:hypothetical protein